MKHYLLLLILTLFSSTCATSQRAFIWSLNPETLKNEDFRNSEEKSLVMKLVGLWELSVASEFGQKRKLICIYDMINSSIYFITIADGTSGWMPGELRYVLPIDARTGSDKIGGFAFLHGSTGQIGYAGIKARTRDAVGIEAAIEPKQIVIRYIESPRNAKNLDGSDLIKGSLQILKKITTPSKDSDQIPIPNGEYLPHD